MLRFIESTDRYSVYERRDGTEVFYAHGVYPLVELVEYDHDWMLEQWASSPSSLRGQRFLDWLRSRLIDPDPVDELRICEDCGDPTHEDDGWTVEGDAYACQSCVDNYYSTCNDCDTYTRETTYTLSENNVCQSCVDSYNYCDDCEGYYHQDYSDEHEHEVRCDRDCESPAMQFSIRNDGHGMLSNDHQVTVSLPAGTIDHEGMVRIRQFLSDKGYYTAARLVRDGGIDARWQTSEGNFTKRLSRATYKQDGSKILPEDLSQIGSIAVDQSKGVDFEIATTRDLNMSAADFAHDASCWWGGYSSSRCSLKSNGGFGLRSFDSYGNVTGRAWVMPLKADERGNLHPTFNTETPDAFVVFNCYGSLNNYNATRVLSHMVGMTYRKIGFTCEPMYINNDSGYLVAPEEIASRYTNGALHLRDHDAHSNLFYTETRELVDA